MKIYFSCSITGGRQDQAVYKAIVDHLKKAGHEVLTQHLAEQDLTQMDQDIDPVVVFKRDSQWLVDCDALIAEVSTPSHGVGYEIAAVLAMGKPSFCCARKDARVSKMLEGNITPGFKFHRYSDLADLQTHLTAFLASLGY